MQRFLSLTLAATLVYPGLSAYPAMANPVDTYNSLSRGFASALLDDGQEDLDRTKTMIAGLGGNWVPMHLAARMDHAPDATLDVASFDDMCGRNPSRFEPRGELAFAILQPIKKGVQEIRLDYLGQGRFVRSRNSDEVAALFGADPNSGFTESEVRLGLRMISPAVSVFQIGPDTLMMVDAYGQVEFWGRCPG